MTVVGSSVGAVAIGRNEGERLKRCLVALLEQCERIVYVDSGSSDGSVHFARTLGIEVVELDMSRAYSAARARNAGYLMLLSKFPDIELIQFVDGDCEVVTDWVATAASVLSTKEEVAVVCGRRRERYPEKSHYNRFIDLEWKTPVGYAASCGGDALYRAKALESCRGFDESVSAGEEPELCKRLIEHGWKILRVDAEMTLHDAALNSFTQWFRRQIRSGYGSLDVLNRFQVELFRQEVRSTRLWTAGWLFATLVVSAFAGFFGGGSWLLIALLAMLGIWILQVLRVSYVGLRAGLTMPQSLSYGWTTMTGKFGAMWGQLVWYIDRTFGGGQRSIEYKSAADANLSRGQV